MRATLRALATGATLATATALLLGACGGGPRTKTEVLGVQFDRNQVTTTTTSTAASEPAATSATPAPAAPAAAPPLSTPPAQTTAPAKSVAAPSPGSIAGRLVVGGDPVEGADVSVTSGSSPVAHTTTDADGRYRVDGLTPGTYQVDVTDHGDDTNVCQPGGTCVTKRPPSESTADVTVASGQVTVANFPS